MMDQYLLLLLRIPTNRVRKSTFRCIAVMIDVLMQLQSCEINCCDVIVRSHPNDAIFLHTVQESEVRPKKKAVA